MIGRAAIAACLVFAGLLAPGWVVLAAEPERAAAAASAGKASVEACLTAAGSGASIRSLENCIGKTAAACIGPDEASQPSVVVTQCYDTEQAQWDRLLNRAYQALLRGLEPDQQAKLRDMQRVWIDSRKKACDFFYDFFQGTMATPMIANCLNQETARRTIFLRVFVDDLPRQQP